MLESTKAATVLCGILLFMASGLSLAVDAGLSSPAFAQDAAAKQFSFTITDRKIAAADNVVRVSQGDEVEISLTADETAELHLHGYDILLTLTPNVPGKIRFTAVVAGRFPLEAHRFGPPASAERHRASGPLLYLEVLPR